MTIGEARAILRRGYDGIGRAMAAGDGFRLSALREDVRVLADAITAARTGNEKIGALDGAAANLDRQLKAGGAPASTRTDAAAQGDALPF